MPSLRRIFYLFLHTLLVFNASILWAKDLPLCYEARKDQSNAEILKQVSEVELLARLVYGEAQSTGYGHIRAVYDAIAWGVMNRVHCAEHSKSLAKRYGKGIRGVIFKPYQFNPAVARRSPFRKDMLCPSHEEYWKWAWVAAEQCMMGKNNPFIATTWEKRHDASLVVNFYYPTSIMAKSPDAPWEQSHRLQYIGVITIRNTALQPKIIKFYRLTHPPRDWQD